MTRASSGGLEMSTFCIRGKNEADVEVDAPAPRTPHHTCCWGSASLTSPCMANQTSTFLKSVGAEQHTEP